MAVPPAPATPDLNKAYGAAGTTLVGGAITKIVLAIVNNKWPGMLTGLDDAIDTVIVAGLAFAGAWLIPHSH